MCVYLTERSVCVRSIVRINSTTLPGLGRVFDKSNPLGREQRPRCAVAVRDTLVTLKPAPISY